MVKELFEVCRSNHNHMTLLTASSYNGKKTYILHEKKALCPSVLFLSFWNLSVNLLAQIKFDEFIP